MSFTSLPRLVADDPALERIIGRAAKVLAVPDPARAIALAGLAVGSDRRPLVVAVPTTADADRLVNDLRVYLGDDEVASFPAWETLPFERVSPSIEAMGHRLRTLWYLRDPDRSPRVVVAPVRALVQRLSPHVDEIEPIIVTEGAQIDPQELVERLVGTGYRREPQVEHRGEVALRGSIVDVFPSTAEGPIRIDLWGDEVERLSRFTIADQRSTDDVDRVEIFPCRELLVTDEVRARAAELVAEEPWGREQWERLSEGLVFDGMESWLPWLTGDDRVLPDLLDADAMVVLVEPRRMRDRGNDLLAEESDLADSLARTWGALDADEHHDFPRLHLAFDRILAKTTAPVVTVTSVPESPDVAVLEASGWDAPGEALAGRLTSALGAGSRLVVTADGAGSADRIAELLAEWGLHPQRHGTPQQQGSIDESPRSTAFTPGGHLVVAGLERGFYLPSVGLGIVTEHELTGRRRAHRKARKRKRKTDGFFDDLAPGDYVVHHQHGVGSVRRHGQAGHRWPRTRLPAARVPRRRQALRPQRPDRSDSSLHRWGIAVAAQVGRQRLRQVQGEGPLRGGRDRPGTGGALPDPDGRRPASPSSPTHPGRTSWPSRSPTS